MEVDGISRQKTTSKLEIMNALDMGHETKKCSKFNLKKAAS